MPARLTLQTELCPDIQLPEALAVNRTVSHHKAAGNKIGIQFFPCLLIHLKTLPDECSDHFRVGRRGYHQKLVPKPDDRVRCRNLHATVRMVLARDHKMSRQEFIHLSDGPAADGLVPDLHSYLAGAVGIGLLIVHLLFLIVYIDAEERTHSEQGENHSHNSERIGHRITHGNGLVERSGHVRHRLLRGTEAGGIGHGSRHHTHHGGHGRSGNEMYRDGNAHTQHDYQHSQHIESQSSLLE